MIILFVTLPGVVQVGFSRCDMAILATFAFLLGILRLGGSEGQQ
jgi:hypothetical protein